MLSRYLKVQARMLFYGMIGPLFVVMYFLSDRDPFMNWFLWSGLLVTAACVLLALGITVAGAKSDAKTAELEQTGVLALAQVLGLEETGTYIEDKPLVKLQLQISGHWRRRLGRIAPGGLGERACVRRGNADAAGADLTAPRLLVGEGGGLCAVADAEL
jgi:hypothetical protein